MKRLIVHATMALLIVQGTLQSGSTQVSVGDILSHVTPDKDTNSQTASQAQTAPQSCGGLQLAPTHPQASMAYLMRNRLSSRLDNIPIIVYSSLDINAYTLIGAQRASGGVICIPQGTVVFFQEAPDELAAVIAHEMGHAIDEACRFPRTTAAQNQWCEDRADEVAFTLLVNSNPPFNPTALAGAFGRLEGLRGGTGTGLLARVSNWSSTHPITPDRVEHVHQMLLKWAAARQ